MKSAFIVWIDRENAKLFQLSEEKMERVTVHSGHADHHTHRMDGLDRGRQERRFYGDVADRLDSDCKILLLGPGVAKHHFMNYLHENCPALSKNIVGCETVDHPSDAQIATMAKRFF